MLPKAEYKIIFLNKFVTVYKQPQNILDLNHLERDV